MANCRSLLFSALMLLAVFAKGQFTDNFSDGNFTASPAWVGETSLFTVNGSQQLQSQNAAITDTIYLATASTAIDSTEWEFWIRLNFAPSSNNYALIYLVSDQQLLNGPLNGYVIRIGENLSADGIDLFRQDGTTLTPIIQGRDSTMYLTNSQARIRVRRDNSGNWSLWSDTNGGFNYVLEGTATDLTYTATSWFGVACRHTTSNATNFFFDDFYAGSYQVDTVAPSVVTVTATSATTVDVQLSEIATAPTAELESNYSANSGLGNPSSALIDATDSTLVHLTFATTFTSGFTYTLTVSNLSDHLGNLMAPPETGNFLWVTPSVASFRSVIINEIFPDPDTTLTNMPIGEFVELYNRSNATFNLNGWRFADAASSVALGNYTLAPGEYLILCKAADTASYSPFGNVLPISLPSLNNTGDQLGLRDNLGTLIDTVSYDPGWYNDASKDDGGWTLELINPTDTCTFLGNWTASNDPDGGTPGQQNSVFSGVADTVAPTIISVIVNGPSTLEVCFSETMDAAQLLTPGNYSVLSFGNATAATPMGATGSCVSLSFGGNFVSGTVYTLLITGIPDCKGNGGTMMTTFALGQTPSPFQVVINELFPDPTPVIGLPEAEFVELYNPTSTVIELGGLELTDGSSVATLPQHILQPGQYVILTATASETDFSPFGTTLGLSSFPSLNNTGDSITLRTAGGTVIDQVIYTDEWYLDDVKADGGWTLERIDPAYQCLNPANWRASINAQGGTPGTLNSTGGTFTDVTAPTVIAAVTVDPSIVRIEFSESMDYATLANPANFTIDNGVGNPVVTSPVGSAPAAVDLLLSAPLDSNIVYCVTVTNVQDCPGNDIGSDNTICFGLPVAPAPGDVVINEILFNPATGGSDFVELYNTSSKVLDLSKIFIGEIVEGTTDSVANASPASDESRLFLPNTYVAITADRGFQISTYDPIDPPAIVEVSDFPTYDDDEGECVITDASGTFLDRFHYLDDYHFPNLDDKEGVSLERLNFFGPSDDPGNWHSAASTVKFATPGYENSQQFNDGTGNTEVWLAPETFSPDNDGVDDVLFIHYHFPEAGVNARCTIFDNKGRLVKIVKQNTLLGTEEGAFTWDGTNETGRKVEVGIYVVLFEAEQPLTGKIKKYKLGCVLAARF